MNINKGCLWLGLEWEKAIKEHIKTSDCYFLEVYTDKSSNLMKSVWVFDCFKLLGYGNRFKEYKTKIPKKFNSLIKEIKLNNKDKFKIVDKYGTSIRDFEKED